MASFVNDVVLRVDIPGITQKRSGKVREVFDLGSTLLLVATDRISAFDVIMPNGIPDKGRVLTQLARFWFRTLRPMCVTHYITCDADYITGVIEDAGGEVHAELRATLEGRATLCIKATAFPVECVVRGYMAGSLWKEYCQAGGKSRPVTLHGHALPGGLRESDQLPVPIFTPATKAESGHDENISIERAGEIVGTDMAHRLEETSIELYLAASELAARGGVIIADTKFEFGMHCGTLTLIDEALTPDSSRFWEAATWEPGRSQASYDKQFVRDWLEGSGWDKTPPAPELPSDVVAATRGKYMDAYTRVVGMPLA